MKVSDGNNAYEKDGKHWKPQDVLPCNSENASTQQDTAHWIKRARHITIY
jgi:hypothetical protein